MEQPQNDREKIRSDPGFAPKVSINLIIKAKNTFDNGRWIFLVEMAAWRI